MNSAPWQMPAAVLVLDFRTKLATVCAWCPDKAAGDAWSVSAGFGVSHGICPNCGPKLSGEAPARPSCAVSSATAGRDRHSLEVPADRIAVAELALLVGLTETEIVRHFQVLCFRPGYDFEQLPSGMILRRAVLPELVGEFAVSGHKGAASRLMTWLRGEGTHVFPTIPNPPPPPPRRAGSHWYAKGVMA